MRRFIPFPLSVALAATLLGACAGGANDADPDAAITADPAPASPAGTMPGAITTSPPASARPAPLPSARSDREVAATTVSRARAFNSPEAAVRALVEAERAIRSPDTPTADLETAAWTQQQAYRDLARNEGWADAVRAEVPEELRDAFDHNVHANVELRRLTEPRTELPDWRIIPPPPPDELLSHYRAAEDEFGVGWEYLAGIHLVESRMGRIRGTSVAGAQGPMQFLPSTWDAYGEGDVNDPRDAILAAARYLVAHGAPEDMDGALYAYNHSDRYVAAIKDHAAVMRADPSAFSGYYHWRVYYRMTDGDRILHEGYGT